MKSNKGISLIVLVITIIVMIILAGAVVLTLSNTGIIDKAQNAVDVNNESSVKTFAEMLWAEAYLNTDKTQEKLEEYVYDRLVAENIDLSEYGIAVTTKGINVVKGWIQDGLYVRRGFNKNGEYNENIEIGSEIKYTPTVDGEVIEDVTWGILGANDKGELLIVSTSKIGTQTIGATNLEEAQIYWLGTVETLNDKCEKYATGEKATGARSITVEDVNKITGYNPETAGCKKGEIDEYGNEITYTFGANRWNYKTTNGLSGTITDYMVDIHYYDGKQFGLAEITVDDNGVFSATQKTVSVKSNYYKYDIKEYLDNDKVLGLLNASVYNGAYLVANTYIKIRGATDGSNIYNEYGLRYILGDDEEVYVDGFPCWYSTGTVNDGPICIRAVVSLEPTIQLTKNLNNVYTYK